jgi:IclR family transcriptional regulator, KDG regulon repressor
LAGVAVKLLKKSIGVLDLFLANDGELSLEDMTKLSGMNKSTVRRIALSLMECGFIRQQRKRGKYGLGLKFLDYAQAVKKYNPLMDIAEPYLIEISQIIDETVSLAIWDGRICVICLSIHPNHPLKVTSYEGTMAGLHYNSIGKAILAEIPEEDLNTRLPKVLTRYTQNTITDVNDLKRHLMNIRQEGVAVDDEEGFVGIRGIGAALKNGDGNVVGALTVLGPSIRLTRERLRECVPIVKETAAKISQALGYARK